MSDRTASGAEPNARNYVVPKHGAGRLVPFQKGQSGNPQGLHSVGEYHRVRKLCADHSEEAARGVIRLMRESDDERIQFMCMTTVMERGIGKPRDHSTEDQARTIVNLDNLSDDERALLAKLMGKVLPKDQP
jgi:hypothetical protein